MCDRISSTVGGEQMKTYSVKQIAEMLDTNPETVRRWIRDNKLKAVQISRKDGNIVSEDDLQRFLRATPKYLPKFATGLAVISPGVGIATFAGSLIASALLSVYNGKNDYDTRVLPADLKQYLSENIQKLKSTVQQKQELILQTQREIEEIQKQIDQNQYLIDHDEIIKEAVKSVIETTINKEE